MADEAASPPRRLQSSRASVASATRSVARTVVDPASFLRVGFDPAYKSLTPSHWAWELLRATQAGDAEFVGMVVGAARRPGTGGGAFNIGLLSEPLGPLRQNIVHVAALANQPGVLESLFTALDNYADAAAEEQRLSVRAEALAVKGGEADVTAWQARTGAELDKVERLYHIKCEQQWLALLATADASGRTVLHYAAAARGVAVQAILHWRRHRFLAPRTSEYAPGAPQILFPADGWVCPHTGALWRPVYHEFPADHADEPQEPPEGYVSVAELLRARRDPAFIDARDVNKATPLHYATVANDVRGIRCLLEHGAECFAVTRQGAAPLDLAANKVVRTALVPVDNAVQISCGLRVQRPGLKTPLGATAAGSAGAGGGDFTDGRSSVAMRRGAAENALVQLVNSGEDINGRSGIKLHAPLHMAADKGSVEVVQLLLTNGAIVDIADVDGRTPLHYAAEAGTEKHLAIVQLLFNAGADVNATSSQRKTPLHMAATGGPLFEPGVNLIPKAPRAGQGQGQGGGGSSSERLGQAGGEGEGEGRPGTPGATGLAGTGSGSEYGGAGGLDDPGDGYSTVVGGAPGGNGDGNTAMIALLVQLGANLEAADTEGNTPLLAAAKRGNHLAVQSLLALGARLYHANIRGHTALHLAAFHHWHAVVRQLVRWDAEIGRLKHLLDASGRSAYDLAADPPTREALHSLFEAAASGRLDLAQSVQRQAALLPPGASAPWLPVRVWECTRVTRRTPLHCAVTGAAKAMAILRRETADKKARAGRGGSAAADALAASGGAGGSLVAAAMSKAVAQRREREAHCDPDRGTGLPPHKVAASAVHVVAGVGLRFVTSHAREAATGGALVPAEYRDWGGDFADVHLTFPVVREPETTAQSVDSYAFVPRPGAHLAFIPTKVLGDTTRSEAAAARVVPGSELTSSQTEKSYGRVCEFLIKCGVDVNAGDADGVTALHLAAKYGLLFLLRKLLLRRADPMLTDAAGNTVLHWAHAFCQWTAADIITEFTRGEGDGEGAGGDGDSVLAGVRNEAGLLPREVQGHGMLILPGCAERALVVGRAPKKSASLAVTQAL